MNQVQSLTGKQFDVTALGEVLIDFTEAGISESGQRLFEQNPGGAPANMLSALAKLGAKTAFIGKAGTDMHGQFLKETMERAGVDTSGMKMTGDVFTTLAFVALKNGERTFSFARKPGADTCLSPEELDVGIIRNSAVLHIGSLSLTDEPARAATLAAVETAKKNGVIVSYDPNYRASLWKSADEAAKWMKRPLPNVDILKISDEETALVSGVSNPEQAALKLNADGIKIVAVTLGKEGALVSFGGSCRIVPGYDVPAADTTGAGDAFWGAFLYKTLQSKKAPEQLTLDEIAEFARFANAAATVCVTRRGGIPAMATLGEVAEIRRKYD